MFVNHIPNVSGVNMVQQKKTQQKTCSQIFWVGNWGRRIFSLGTPIITTKVLPTYT